RRRPRRIAAGRRRRARRAAAAAARPASLSSRHFAIAHAPGHDRSAGAGPMNPLVTTGQDRRRDGTALSVNVNKIALLRNQRPLAIPSVVGLSRIALDAGAHGITVHPRPDERHIRRDDVFELAAMLKDRPEAEFN